MTRWHLTRRSANRKLGPIATVTSERSTCPGACPLKEGGCYAEHGSMRAKWDKVGDGRLGERLPKLLRRLRDLPRGTVLRLFDAGDMPGTGDHIDADEALELADACAHLRGGCWGYTHKPVLDDEANRVAVEAFNQRIALNLSANGPAHADELADLAIAPVACVLPALSRTKNLATPKGRRVVVCPAQISRRINCASCGGRKGPLCARIERDFIVGFLAHGKGSGSATRVAQLDIALSHRSVPKGCGGANNTGRTETER